MLEREGDDPQEVDAEDKTKCDDVLGDIEDAAELAKDELGRANVGHQEQIKGAEVALGGDGRDCQGVKKQEAEDEQRDQCQREAAMSRLGTGTAELPMNGERCGREERQVNQADRKNLAAVCPGADFAPEDGIV